MQSLEGVEPFLRAKVEEMLRLSGGRLWVNSASRSSVEQQQLWDRWVEGLRRYGSRDKAIQRGIYPANPPGRSKHELAPAEAVDVGCAMEDRALRDELAQKCGLLQPIYKEPWHMENNLKVVLSIEGDDDEMPKPDSRVDACLAPGGGTWVLTYDGGVRAEQGAPFYGSYPGLPPNERQGTRNFIAIERQGGGYTVIADDGSTYHFNAEVKERLDKGNV